jgi:hypothetical protein
MVFEDPMASSICSPAKPTVIKMKPQEEVNQERRRDQKGFNYGNFIDTQVLQHFYLNYVPSESELKRMVFKAIQVLEQQALKAKRLEELETKTSIDASP